MTREEAESCIGTIEMLRTLAYNIHGVMDVIDADNCEKIIKALSQEPCDTVSIRKDILKCRVGNIVAYNVEWLKEHWQMEMDIVCGVKPCDDAVSRQAVHFAIFEWIKNGEDVREDYAKQLLNRIGELPPVQPKSETVTEFADRCRECGAKYGKLLEQKSGKWIAYEVQLPDRTILNYRCSVCGRKLIGYNTETLSEAPFCHCGAKMVEPQERSDKE